MNQAPNSNVEQEVVAPEEESSSEVKIQSQSQEPEYGSKEYNMREMRKLIERQDREIQDLKELAYQRMQPQAKEDEDDDLDGVDKDALLTRGQAERLAFRKAQELIQQQEVANLEDKTRLKFRDYDDVVTEENVKNLIDDDRDLADSIKNSPNPYATAYKFIKKASFYQESTKKKPPKEEAEKIIKNAQKPVSANAVQSRPLSQANAYMNLNEQEKVDVYREMMHYAGRR